jgi:hypothetical protein
VVDRKVCPTCGEGFIGRSNSVYCRPACRVRAHRGRDVTDVTLSAADSAPVDNVGGHCPEAVRLLAALDVEKAANSEALGLPPDEPLEWSAAELAVLEMLACALDRKRDLLGRYEDIPDINGRLKLSAELRLLEASVARLLKQVDTNVPATAERSFKSPYSSRAQKAARVRWGSNGAS